MKIIISESQELDVKKKFIFMLLNNKNYNLVEIGDNIYFVKKIGDEYSEIRFDKSDDGWCRISYKLITFLSSITGFQESEVQELIVKWVEHTLQMEVKYNANKMLAMAQFKLNIPYKWR
jgi:hypothetical protein